MPKAYLNRTALEVIQKERLDLAENKNNDYGGRGDNIAIGGVHGVAIRMLDKAMRLVSLTTPGQAQKVADESIRQTFQDSGNYADFGVSLLDETWGVRPEEPKPPMNMDANFETVKKATGMEPHMMTMEGVTLPVSVVKKFFHDMGEIKESFGPIHVPVDFETRIMDGSQAGKTSQPSKKRRKKSGGVIVPYPLSKQVIKMATKKAPAPKARRKAAR